MRMTPSLTVTQEKKKRVLEPHIHSDQNPFPSPPFNLRSPALQGQVFKVTWKESQQSTLISDVSLSPEARGFQRPALLGVYRGERGLNPLSP